MSAVPQQRTCVERAALSASSVSLTGFAIIGVAMRHRTSSVLQSWIGTVTAFTASRSPLIVQPRLRDQAD